MAPFRPPIAKIGRSIRSCLYYLNAKWTLFHGQGSCGQAVGLAALHDVYEVGMKVRLAVLGLGGIARSRLLPAVARSEAAQLWSVLSRNRQRAGEAARNFGAASSDPAHDRLEALLADPDLDGVIIAAPDALHAPIAIAAAKAGKHVLTEKPMAISLDQADAMIAACDAGGVCLGVAYHLRWHPALRALWRAAQDGRFGILRHMRLQWTWLEDDNSDWRAKAESTRWWSMSGVGTHMLDQILWFLTPSCGDVVEIRTVLSREVWGGPHDETAIVAVRFESGATAEFCSSVLIRAPSRFELYGSNGWMVGRDIVSEGGGGTVESHEGPWNFEPCDPYLGEIDDFAAAIRDRRPPEVDGHMGRRNCALMLRAIA